MRGSIGLLVVVFQLSGFGIAQTTSGHSELVPSPGTYASPFVPQVTTPEVQFATPALQVGATNATAGNIAGASNSTVETINATGGSVSARSEASTQQNASSPGDNLGGAPALDLGGSIFDDSVGVATLAAGQKGRTHATRTYTNQDIERMKGATEK